VSNPASRTPIQGRKSFPVIWSASGYVLQKYSMAEHFWDSVKIGGLGDSLLTRHGVLS